MTPSKVELGFYRRNFTIGLRELKEISEQKAHSRAWVVGERAGLHCPHRSRIYYRDIILAGFEVSLKVGMGQKSDLRVVPEEELGV